jgi:hypothetical protein
MSGVAVWGVAGRFQHGERAPEVMRGAAPVREARRNSAPRSCARSDRYSPPYIRLIVVVRAFRWTSVRMT